MTMTVDLAVYVHNIDPYVLKLWEGGPIKWYGLSYLVGFVLAFFVMRRVARVGLSTVPPTRVADMVIVMAVGVVVGGRMGYVLFYQPSLLIQVTGQFPFWGVLALHKGGMASHGGMIGAILACVYFSWRYRHRLTHILDLAAFGAPVGMCLGRIANFVNGELYGRPCDPGLLWAVKFPQEMDSKHWIVDDPVRINVLYQAIDRMGLNQINSADGQLWIPNLITAIQQGNEQIIQILAPHITARHPSQIYQALLEGLLVFLVLAIVWMRPRKPCVIGAMYLLTYGIARIIGEFFRQPDEHIQHLESQILCISRGQLLSIPMIVVGLILLWHFGRKSNPPMGGWRSQPARATN